MLFLKILLGIVLFFVLLFSMNLKLDVAMFDTLTLRAGLGPIMLTLSPGKERKIDPADFSYEKHQKRLLRDRKKAAKKAEKKRLKSEEKAKKKAEAEAAKAAAETVEKKKFPLGFILALIKFAIHELELFIGYFHIELVALDITVGGKDAAAVGKSYGCLSQGVEYLLEILKHKTKMKPLKEGSVAVRADFLLEKTKINVHFKLKLRLSSFLKVGWHALVWFIKQKLKEGKSGGHSQQNKPKKQPAKA